VLDRALDALICRLEQRKFAATEKPRRRPRRSTGGGRYIPADVRRTVWKRDGGQCSFVSEAGRRCPARTVLEFDHVEPVARGGQATAAGVRLHCRAKREQARRLAEARRRAAEAEARARAAVRDQAKDVLAGLRELGFRVAEAR